MTEPQQPKAAPTNNQNSLDDPTNTIDNKVDEIEFYIGELIVDILEDVGEVFAPKQPDGSPERKKLLGLVGDIQPYRERATQAIHAAINKTIMEEVQEIVDSTEYMHSIDSENNVRRFIHADKFKQLLAKKYGRADNE